MRFCNCTIGLTNQNNCIGCPYATVEDSLPHSVNTWRPKTIIKTKDNYFAISKVNINLYKKGKYTPFTERISFVTQCSNCGALIYVKKKDEAVIRCSNCCTPHFKETEDECSSTLL